MTGTRPSAATRPLSDAGAPGGLSRMLAALIDRPLLVLVATLCLAVGGVLAFVAMPIATMPEVEFPTMVVEARLPGASGEVVAATLAAPLERALQGVPGLADIASESSLGRTSIRLRFGLDRSLAVAATDVQAALSSAAGDLPSDMPAPPVFRNENPTVGSAIFLSFRSRVLTPEDLSTLVDTVATPMLRGVPGVGGVAVYGQQKLGLDITVDPARLSAHRLTIDQVRRAIETGSVNRPKGALESDTRRSVLAADDQLDSEAAFGALIVAQRGSGPVRLRDVADVRYGPEDRTAEARVDDTAAVVVGVRRASGANTLATVTGLRALAPALRQALPPTVELEFLADRSISVRESVHEVQWTLLLTIVLVSLTILAFVRNLRAAAVAAVVIPLSILGTFVVMRLCGFSLNNISMMALTICIGLVVDDAVVVIEDVMARIEAGMPAREAAIASLSNVGFTVLAITVSLLAAFVPLLFMSGLTGRMFREFGVTLAVAVGLSGITSLAVTPVLCRFALGGARPPPGGESRLEAAYGRSLRWALRRPGPTLLAFGLATLASGWLYATMPKGFFPEQDTRQINGGLVAPPDASPTQMRERMRSTLALLREDPAVARAIGTVSGTTVFFLIDLRPAAEGVGGSRDYIARMRNAAARLPELGLFLQIRPELVLGDVTGRSQYEYRVSAADLDTLRRWVPRLVERLRARPELVNVDVDGLESERQRFLRIDRTRAAEQGVSIDAIDDTLYDAFGSRRIARVYTETEQLPVMLRLPRSLAGDERTLDVLHVEGQGGALVPLSSLVRASTTEGAKVVHHQTLRAAATITFDVAPGASLDAALEAISQAAAALDRPAGLHADFTGGASEFQRTLSSQGLLVGLALLSMWAVLTVLYGNALYPVSILSTLPTAGIGALLALTLLGRPLDMMGFVGLILLIGIVKKNAIMVIDRALARRREAPGLTLEEALAQAATERLRPILMTTLAAAVGAVPLALDSGMGSELRRPLGIVVLSGLIASQLLTLYSVPVVHRLLAALSERRLSPARTSDLHKSSAET